MEKEARILTPTNFSICAASALSYTAFLAKKLKAIILLCHILPSLGPPDRFEKNKKSAAILEQDARYWRAKGYLIETLLLSGSRAQHIADAAEDWDCRYIVMGLSSQRQIKDYMVGSLAERVIRLSDTPVIVVKESKEEIKSEALWKSETVLEGGLPDPI